MHRTTFVLILSFIMLLASATGSASEAVKLPGTERCDILEINPAGNIMVLFRNDCDPETDFSEGHIYLYNLENGRMEKLNEEIFILEFTKCEWKIIGGEEWFLLTTEKGIEAYSFSTGRRSLVVKDRKDEIIYDFSLSHSGRYLAFVRFERRKEGSYQVVYLLDRTGGKSHQLIHFPDPDIGGGLYFSRLAWSNSDRYLFVVSNESDLFQVVIPEGKSVRVDENLSDEISLNPNLLLVRDDDLLYPKGKEVLRLDASTGRKYEVARFGERTEFVQLYGNDEDGGTFVIMPKRILCIDEKHMSAGMFKSEFDGRIVFVKKGTVFQKKGTALWKTPLVEFSGRKD